MIMFLKSGPGRNYGRVKPFSRRKGAGKGKRILLPDRVIWSSLGAAALTDRFEVPPPGANAGTPDTTLTGRRLP